MGPSGTLCGVVPRPVPCKGGGAMVHGGCMRPLAGVACWRRHLDRITNLHCYETDRRHGPPWKPCNSV